VRDLFLDRAGIDAWLQAFAALHVPAARPAAAQRMLATNPKYVLRNHLGELAIRAAQQKDFSVVADLLGVLQSPFDEHPQQQAFADFAPDWAAGIAISCSS
jgi:serine/tyrosine/threonine adenylyltransferase